MSSPIYQAIKQLSDEKNIPFESVIATIEAALAAAFRKDFGKRKDQNIKVVFDPETGDFEVFDVKTVVEDMELPTEEELAEMEKVGFHAATPVVVASTSLDEAGNPVEDTAPKFNPKTDVMISQAKEMKPDAEIGEVIKTKLEVPAAFGRMAAQTAKQVIIQNVREAERTQVFADFKDKEGQLITATVQRREGKLVLIDLGSATAVMPPEEQIPTDRYNSGDRLKVYVVSVRLTSRGPEILVSRTHPDMIRKLFTLEIPEVSTGVVEINGIAREPGARAKVAVSTKQDNIDPIGSCIGQRGTRIQTIINELSGEKIDIIEYSDESGKFIKNALSPAKIISINIDEPLKVAEVLVAPDQLSLAIGRGGQNVRLASKLTGYKISVRETVVPEAIEEKVEDVVVEDETKE